jgi:glutamate-1-semialdehyde 2,1-aminomutase
MEPCLFEEPKTGFLEGVAALCAQHGALFILDEMLTGFRWARAGGQEYFRVAPDLATFGKGLANGMPLACLVGKYEHMKHATVVSGTFGGETLSLAACAATLGVYEEEDVCGHMAEIGERLTRGFNALHNAQEVGARMEGYPCHPRVVFADDPDHSKMSLFLEETAMRGVLLHPSGLNVMLAHTTTHVDQTLEACANALFLVGITATRSGELIQPNPFRPVGI